ncbi:aminoglycoside phosphotransferase family protein [Glutamicibacter bergerei]|uniref:Aminoglycoside phosphotransferase family protein n=1 Tax=Glutamicibacter bergerei TaxID=256702 RepID=A0ABV9MLW2_9MICC|nr:aminoglycoside phosphotransferase [Micrococcaceae bacterium]
MNTLWTPRISWAQLPEHVRNAVEVILGSPVVEAHGQQGGFSPGTADRVRTADGRRAFVKAVGTSLNAVTPRLHRAEAKISALLPGRLPVPKYLGSYDKQGWVALVLEDIPGSHPKTPWTRVELERVLDSLHVLGSHPVPSTLTHLPALHTEVAAEFTGWDRIDIDLPSNLDPWIADHLPRLQGSARTGLSCLEGQSLVHSDIRSDNLLLTEEGAYIVDWPWACIGAPWFDALSVLINVRLHDAGFDVASVLGTHPVFVGLSAENIDGFLAGMSGYFIDGARQPAPSGLPTLRSFQQAQGEATIGWLRERWEPTA